MKTVLKISNRNLNEISQFMVKDGYATIAKFYVIPIVLMTAAKGDIFAEITDPKTIEHVEYFQKKMKAA